MKTEILKYIEGECKLCWQCFFNPKDCGEMPTREIITTGSYKGETTDKCSGFKDDT